MYLPPWLRIVRRRLFGTVPARRRKAPQATRVRPHLEALEDRVVPSNIGLVVDNNTGTNSATVFDPTTNKVLGSVGLSAPGGPVGDVVTVNNGTLGFVTDFANQLIVLNLTNPTNPTLASGNNPISISNLGEDIAVSPDQQFLVVSDGSGPNAPLSVVSVASQTQIGTFNLGSDANSVDITNTDSVLVTSPTANDLRRLTINSSGTLTDTGESMSISAPNQVAAAPGGASGIVLSRAGSIESFLIPGLTPVDTRSVSGGDALCAVFDQAGDRVYVRSSNGSTSGEVTVFGFDPTTGQLSSSPLLTIPVASALTYYGIDQLAISQDGSELYVPDDTSHSIDVFDTTTGTQVATITSSSISQPLGITIVTSQGTAAKVTAQNASATFSTNNQTVGLTANVTSTQTVNEGTVTFTVKDSNGNTVGSPVQGNVSGNASGGVASANFTLPADEPVGTYAIDVSYSDSANKFYDNGDTNGTLTITPANVTTSAVAATAYYSPNQQSVALNATLTDDSFSSDTVDEGTVFFTVMNGSTKIGSGQGTVTSSGTASGNVTLPAGLALGTYTIDVSYSDGAGNFSDDGDNGALLTLNPANVTTTANKVSTVYSVSSQTVKLSASVADTSIPTDIMNEGTVTFTVMNGSTSLGSIPANVQKGAASANFTLLAGQAAGTYTIDVSYLDSAGNFSDNGDNSAPLIIASAAATTTAADESAVFRPGAQNVTLTAGVTSNAGPVNEGTVTFTVMQGSTVIGSATTSGTVSNGAASVSYALPANLAAGTYTIDAVYNPGPDFQGSSDDSHTLTVSPASVTTSAIKASALYSPNKQTVALNATLADDSFSGDTVDEGTVTFTVLNGLTVLGSAPGTVSGGAAGANVTLPAGLAVGSYTIAVSYSDSQGNFTDSNNISNTLTVSPANVTVTAVAPPTVVYSSSAQNMTLSATVADTSNSSDVVNEGSVVFTIMNGQSAIRSVVGAVTGGTANANFTLPPGQAAGSYTIDVSYIDSPSNFVDSGDKGTTLTVSPANVAVTANKATAAYSPNAQSLLLSATVADTSDSSQTVFEGTVTFTVMDGTTKLGSATGVVSNGNVNAPFTLPAGQAVGSYTIDVRYDDTQGNFADSGSGDNSALLTVSSVSVSTAAANVTAFYSPNSQTLKLNATVANLSDSNQPVGEGIVTFTVKDSKGNPVGTPVPVNVSGGAASADFTLPAGQAIGNYTIAVGYLDGSGNFVDSGDQSATLSVLPANVTTTANKVSAVYNTNTQTLALSATLADDSIPTDTVDAGTVTFTITNGSTPLGSVAGAVSGGTASANFALLAGQAAGSYTIAVSYSDKPGNFTDSGDSSAVLTVSPAEVTTIPSIVSTVYSPNKQIVELSAGVTDASVPGDTVDEGTVTFTIQNGNTAIGSVSGAVSGGTAHADLTLPAGLAPGSYTLAVSYNDGLGNFSDGGDSSSTLTVASANVTTTAAANVVAYSPGAQTVTLNANVANTSVPSATVNEGTVTFTILSGSTPIGSVSGTVSGGKASANLTLPAGLAAGSYIIAVSYSDKPGNLSDGGDTDATLTIAPAPATTTAVAASTTFSTKPQTVTLSAVVADSNNAVGEGIVTFTIANGSTILGSVQGTVSGGTANAHITLPAGLAAGSYALAVSYSDSQGNFSDGGDNNARLTVGAAGTTAQLTQITLAPTLLSLTTTETLTAHVSSSTPVTQGTVTFFVSGHAITANVDGNGNATAVVTMPMLALLGPQDVSVRYNDAANNRTPSTDAETAAWRIFNPVVPSTATFAPNSDSVTADLFGLFITYTNGLLTEIDFGSIHLVFSYNASGQLSQVTFDGMNLLT